MHEKHKILNRKSFKYPLPGENGRNLEGPKPILVHIPVAEEHSARTRVRMDLSEARAAWGRGLGGLGLGREVKANPSPWKLGPWFPR